MNTFPKITTSRCELDRICRKDIPILQSILCDDITGKYFPELYDFTTSEDDMKQLLSSFDNLFVRKEGILWGIFLMNELIGFIAVMDIPDYSTLLYAMHPAHRSKGYMCECITAVIDYISRNKICDYLRSEVYGGNIASIKLLQAANFEIVERNEQKVFFKRVLN